MVYIGRSAGRNQYLFGLAAALGYVATVVVGGRLWPGYTIYQAISELTLPTAPDGALIAGCFVFFNLLLLTHGLAIILNFWRNVWLRLSGFLYFVAAAAGLVMAYIPMDPRLSDPTVYGTIHRYMATIAICDAVLIVFTSAAGFNRVNQLRYLVKPSLIAGTLIALTAFGVWMSALQHSLLFGTFQKISLGLFMLWLALISLALRRSH